MNDAERARPVRFPGIQVFVQIFSVCTQERCGVHRAQRLDTLTPSGTILPHPAERCSNCHLRLEKPFQGQHHPLPRCSSQADSQPRGQLASIKTPGTTCTFQTRVTRRQICGVKVTVSLGMLRTPYIMTEMIRKRSSNVCIVLANLLLARTRTPQHSSTTGAFASDIRLVLGYCDLAYFIIIGKRAIQRSSRVNNSLYMEGVIWCYSFWNPREAP